MRNCLLCGARFYPGNFNLETAKVCSACRPAVKRVREALRRSGRTGVATEEIVAQLKRGHVWRRHAWRPAASPLGRGH